MESASAGRGEIGIVGNGAHTESDSAAGDFRSNAAHAKNTERLSVELDSLKAFSIPFSGFHAGVSLRNVSSDRDQQRKRVLCSGNGVSPGRIHDDDPTPGGCFDVDTVSSHSR